LAQAAHLRSRLRVGTSILIALAAATALAQTNPAAQAAREWRQQHERAIVDEFITLLAIPNIARDRDNIQRNAETIARMMEQRGIVSKLVTVPGANPVVFGEIRTPGATRTIVFYAHYDGQPLDPKEWATPPFEPALRDKPVQDGGTVIPLPSAGQRFDPESRLYARGAGDDKAPIAAMMAALDAIRASGIKMRSNIKFAFEGEEEAGSPNLEKILEANKPLFAGGLWLMCDGPVYQTRQQQIVFGARGDTGLDVTIYGPRYELHSGHYGNWALNPAMMLAQLLASMKNAQGHVLVDHFYDGITPLSPLEKRAIAEAPAIDAGLMHEFWLGSTEGSPAKLNELVTVPALNIRGMASSRTGNQASNVIPATATASLDIRLVAGMDARQTNDRVVEHIRKQGFFVADKEPDAEIRRSHPKVAMVVVRGGDNAVRTPMDLPISQEVIRVVESVRGTVVKLPNMGGSLPLTSIVRPLGTHVIVVPIANHDDNQHSFNENLRIQNLWDGIELMAALLTM
jgi:acetylornithine deacetylase/succinyl-diaminopimelate desuccinylase-like protein